MKTALREQAVTLRVKDGWSYGAIKKQLGVSKSTLSYWLRDFPLNEEKIKELRLLGLQRGEAGRERYRNTMRQKRAEEDRLAYEEQYRQLESLSREAFYVAGLMLYLGEGEKKTAHRIVLANTDPWAVSFFINWMVEFLDVKREAVRIQLHLYENMDIAAEQRFWITTLGIPASQYYKSAIRRLRAASYSYRESYRHGTCSIYVLGTSKKRMLMMAIKALLARFNEYIINKTGV